MVNDTIEEKTEKSNNNKLTKSDKKNKKIPKEISQQILKKMFRSLLKAVCLTLYFIILNLAYTAMRQERLLNDIKVFSGVFLVAGIYFLEKAYKEDSGIDALSGIEFFVISLHSLSIMHIITLFKYDFRLYLLTSSYIFSIYFVLKAIILYTKGRREYLKGLSDISDIVKKDEPLKKEAKKRTPEERERRLKQKKHREEKNNTEVRKKKKKKTTSQSGEKISKTKKEEKRPVKKKQRVEEVDEIEKPEKVVKKKKTTSKTTKHPSTSKVSKTTTSKTTKSKSMNRKKADELPKKGTKRKTTSKNKE